MIHDMMIGKSTKQTSFVHLITKQARFFILKIFLPPDWSLSDNVSDWFSKRLGPTRAQLGPRQFCESQYPV